MSDGIHKMYDEWDRYMYLCEELNVKGFVLFDEKWCKHLQQLEEIYKELEIKN